MIDSLILKFGKNTDSDPLEFNVTPVTVFVGPNNAGKSRVLIELESYCKNARPDVRNNLLVNLVRFSRYSQEEIESELHKIELPAKPHRVIGPQNIVIGKLMPQANRMNEIQINKEELIKEAQNPTHKRDYYSTFLNIYTLRLDGTNRLNMLTEQDAGDLKSAPQNHLAHLFVDNDLRASVKQIVHDAFSKYLVIDPTKMGKLSVRLSDREPRYESEEKGWQNDAVVFHKAAIDINEASDGVRAFIGIVATILAGDPKIILLDEPEAFLHPSLAFKLGIAIASSLRNTNKRLFVSTHSSNFLMGCIQTGVPLNIVRLTYNYETPKARLLPQDKILTLFRHPLLRSSGVLSGLFYQSVIVCESDADRAFYNEINERLLARGDSRGIQGCLFINAQNKQTVWQIVKPLRELGIPAVGIVDIDFLKDGGSEGTKALEAAFIPTLTHESLHNQRQKILNALKGKDQREFKRQGGVYLLTGQEREAARNLLGQLQEYGIFIVDGGELESWLKDLGATGHGPAWLIDIFEKMGENPDQVTYLQPNNGDVWDFIGAIKMWVSNSQRKGIPA